MNETTAPINKAIVKMVKTYKVIKHEHLWANLSIQFSEIKPNDIEQAISEASQDGRVRRFRIKYPEDQVIYYIYLPIGSQIY